MTFKSAPDTHVTKSVSDVTRGLSVMPPLMTSLTSVIGLALWQTTWLDPIIESLCYVNDTARVHVEYCLKKIFRRVLGSFSTLVSALMARLGNIHIYKYIYIYIYIYTIYTRFCILYI